MANLNHLIQAVSATNRGLALLICGLLFGGLLSCDDKVSDQDLIVRNIVAAPKLMDSRLPALLVGQNFQPMRLENEGGKLSEGSCQSEPQLPAGLTVELTSDGQNCLLSGRPTAATARADYRITANNSSGMSTAVLSIEVLSLQTLQITNLSSGNNHNCAIRNNGQLLCWGGNAQGQLGNGQSTELTLPTVIGEQSDWQSVTTGNGVTCAINQSNQLWCWGASGDNRLGLGTTSGLNHRIPNQINAPLGNWLQVSAGGIHTCAISSEGSLFCWGRDRMGSLGSGRFESASGQIIVLNTPTRVGQDNDWMQISAGGEHTCAIKQNGQLWCWGSYAEGQLGEGKTMCSQLPALVGAESEWTQVASGQQHSCAVKTNGQLFCWGSGAEGQLGDGSATNRNSPTRVGMTNNWMAVSAGNEHSCAADDQGRLYCWGKGDEHRLGNGEQRRQDVPVANCPASRWVQVSAGLEHSCAIELSNADAASGALYCWGKGGDGQLGTGNSTDSGTAVRVGDRVDWSSVAAGHRHTCALAEGSLYCWGSNNSGQLGTGNNTPQSTPVRVGNASDWLQVDTGAQHTCAIRNENDLYCWGSGENGRLGNASQTSVNQPVAIAVARDWLTVQLDDAGTCGITSDNNIYCWGSRYPGATETTTPAQIGAGSRWLKLSVGAEHGCATRTGNRATELLCAGLGSFGKLGTGNLNNSDTPISVVDPGLGWMETTSGRHHSCAITPQNSLYCWGQGQFGQVGTGVTTNLLEPTRVSTDEDWFTISAGGDHTCGLKTNRNLYCWGSNSSGQLGHSNSGNALVPIRISLERSVTECN